MSAIDEIDREAEQMSLDAYIHGVVQQRGIRTVADLIADGLPSVTMCGYTTWVPRVAVAGDIECPQCVALLANGTMKTVLDAEVPMLPDWWLRLTGRLPKR